MFEWNTTNACDNRYLCVCLCVYVANKFRRKTVFHWFEWLFYWKRCCFFFSLHSVYFLFVSFEIFGFSSLYLSFSFYALVLKAHQVKPIVTWLESNPKHTWNGIASIKRVLKEFEFLFLSSYRLLCFILSPLLSVANGQMVVCAKNTLPMYIRHNTTDRH